MSFPAQGVELSCDNYVSSSVHNSLVIWRNDSLHVSVWKTEGSTTILRSRTLISFLSLHKTMLQLVSVSVDSGYHQPRRASLDKAYHIPSWIIHEVTYSQAQYIAAKRWTPLSQKHEETDSQSHAQIHQFRNDCNSATPNHFRTLSLTETSKHDSKHEGTVELTVQKLSQSSLPTYYLMEDAIR